MLKRISRSISTIVGASIAPHNTTLPFPFRLDTSLQRMAELHPRTRYSLPSVLMRAGTSKGLFIHRHHMPANKSEWGSILLAAMGSRYGDQKQIDGVGGATSTTSKVAIISKSTRPDADVDYTFAQVAVGQGRVDFTGNCGNMASGVGPFALDEGLVHAIPGQNTLDVRIFNTNTKRVLIDTIKVGSDGYFDETGDYKIGGVLGTGSEVKVSFLNPAGSMTGTLFPTGKKQDEISVFDNCSLPPFTVRASLIDAANPFIFIDSSTLPPIYHQLGSSAPESLEIIEAIRRQGAVMYGLAKDIQSASLIRGTPKIAVLSPPRTYDGHETLPDIQVTSYSMGKVHPTLQLTGAVCLGAAVCIDGTVAHDLSAAKKSTCLTPPEESSPTGCFLCGERDIKIRHGGGVIAAAVKLSRDGPDDVLVNQVTISRTARRLFEGSVLFNL